MLVRNGLKYTRRLIQVRCSKQKCVCSIWTHMDFGDGIKNLYVYLAHSHAQPHLDQEVFRNEKTLRESDRQLRYDF